MSEHRVGELRLDVRAERGRRGELEASAKAFASRVLEACGEKLESRFPGRMIFLRRLPVHWDLHLARLADSDLISDLASQLAAGIGGRIAVDSNDHSAQGDFAVFESEASWRASFLAARAARRGTQAWYFDSLRAEHGSLTQFLERAGVEAVLDRLYDLDALQGVIAAASPEELSSVCSRLELRGPDNGRPPASGSDRANGTDGGIPPAVLQSLAEAARRFSPGLPIAAAAILLFFEAKRLLGRGASRARVVSATNTALGRLAKHNDERRTAARSASGPENVQTEPGKSSGDVSTQLATEYGGLFYLLSLALELGLAESLWKACLPEGLALARLLAELLPADAASDPAPAAAGGVDDWNAPFEVSLQQQRTVAPELLASLAAALPRRGLSSLPGTILFIDEGETGKMLAAAPPTAETLLFAWPFEDRESLLAGLEIFLSGWPSSAPPIRALPALAALDVRGRLQAAKDAVPNHPPLRFDGEPLAKRALLAQSAGSLLYLFAARAKWEVRYSADLVAEYLHISGQIAAASQTLVVHLPAQAARTELRGAALDRNPGWAAWLSKDVKLRFGAAETKPQDLV